MAKQDDYIRYTIRVPADLYKSIELAAYENNRSNNAEIIARLEASFNQDYEALSKETAAMIKRIERLEETVGKALEARGLKPPKKPKSSDTEG